jgi:putative Mn2+ efflux pump MntP
MWLTLIALVVPLGLDTFAVAAALGMSGLTRRRDRIRVTTLFTVFETGMPIVGVVLGAVAGKVAGTAADYVAIVILIGLGVFMLWPRRNDRDESERVGLLARTRGLAAIGLGISISLDELAIGFTLGLLRFSVVLVIALIGIQTLIVTQAGLRLGSRIGEAVRERAEQLAGVVLAALGVILLAQRLLSGA